MLHRARSSSPTKTRVGTCPMTRMSNVWMGKVFGGYGAWPSSEHVWFKKKSRPPMGPSSTVLVPLSCHPQPSCLHISTWISSSPWSYVASACHHLMRRELELDWLAWALSRFFSKPKVNLLVSNGATLRPTYYLCISQSFSRFLVLRCAVRVVGVVIAAVGALLSLALVRLGLAMFGLGVGGPLAGGFPSPLALLEQ